MKYLVVLTLLFFAAPGFAHPGWGIVIDGKGNVFYTDLKQVWKVAPNGARTVAVGNVHAHELYLDSDGTLSGEHLWYDGTRGKWGHYIWELTADGRTIRHVPREGFRTEVSFVRDQNGTMYWLDGARIMKRTVDGRVLQLAGIGRQLQAPGRAPGGILAVTRDGTVYVVSGGDLLRVTPDGRTLRLATGLDEHSWTSFMTQPWHYVMGLAIDSDGNVYIANAGARKVKKVATGGKVTVVLQSRFPWSPTGIAVRDRELYVLEYTDTGGSTRVRKVGADGHVTTFP